MGRLPLPLAPEALPVPAAETFLFLFGAGVLGGIVSVLVSLASLVTFPALLAVGLPPVAANVTNTVSLTFTGVGAALGSRHELRGQRADLAPLAAAGALGGLAGAALLLLLPDRSFELVAPVLMAAASILLLVQPRLRIRGGTAHPHRTPSRVFAYFLVTVYTGYFGAAGGVLALVVLGTMLARPFIEVNAAKNALAGVANGVAAVAFALFGPVAWWYVVPMAAGLFTGGLIGPAIARRVPGGVLRVSVAACGLLAAAVLGRAAYGFG
jgi:uncharacterized membrane protein YfcA